MATYRTSRILPTILTIIVIIVVIAGLVALGRLIFSGSSSSGSSEPTNVAQQNLLSTDANRSVSMTVRGPIVADEDFRSYRISVSPNARSMQAFKGYLDTVISQQNLSNNTAAYSQFVHALDKANLTAGDELEGEANDVLGICATGKVYQFFILKDNQTQNMFWTSTCKGSPGSITSASVAQLSALFLAQVPESSAITETLDL